MAQAKENELEPGAVSAWYFYAQLCKQKIKETGKRKQSGDADAPAAPQAKRRRG